MIAKRNAKEISIWMKRAEVRPSDIALQLGVSRSLVSATINGRKNNRRVLAYLEDAGCPERFLRLPEDMRRGR
jgi:predicted transcriptional regulator